MKIIFLAYNNRLINEGFYMRASLHRFLSAVALQIEGKYLKYFNEILNEPVVKSSKSYKDKLELFNLKTSYNGESFDNVLKILHLKEQHPGISLLVQSNPSYCCPSLVTEAMTSKMEKVTGIPIFRLNTMAQVQVKMKLLFHS